MDCLLCGKKLNVLRQLHGEEFCSAAHRKAYQKKQNDSAIDYLIQSKPRYARESLPAVEAVVGPAPVPEAEPALIPIRANFVTGHIVAAGVTSTPVFSATRRWAHGHPVLPRAAHIGSGKVWNSTFVRASLRAAVPPGRIDQLTSAPLEFLMAPPCIPARLMQPMWIGVQPAEGVEHRNAGFVKPILRQVRSGRGVAYAAALPPFAIPPVILNAASVLTGPILRLATAVDGNVEITGRRRDAPPLAEVIWSSTPAPAHVPQAAKVLVASRLRARERIGFLPSAQEAPARLRPASAACNWVKEAPQMPEAVFRTQAALLQTALRIQLTVPRHVSAASGLPVTGREALVWRLPLQLPSGQSPPIRPPFNSPPPDSPVQAMEPALIAPLARPGASYWQLIPAAKRRWIVRAPLVLAMLALTARLLTLAPVRSGREALLARIHERAAIELQDDFRSGLSQWTGVSGWAETWSYDPTGFARPGRLALFAHATALTDYRFDFLTEIDNKSVSWVFRASDVHNYYVTKLLQSKSATNSAFSIVRYAVIGGHEGPKMHLPLPSAAPGRRMFWVRQEIRGVDFTTYVDGRLVDTWSDPRLASGGIGFFSDSGESAYIRSIQVTENNDILGKLCSLMAAADRK